MPISTIIISPCSAGGDRHGPRPSYFYNLPPPKGIILRRAFWADRPCGRYAGRFGRCLAILEPLPLMGP